VFSYRSVVNAKSTTDEWYELTTANEPPRRASAYTLSRDSDAHRLLLAGTDEDGLRSCATTARLIAAAAADASERTASAPQRVLLIDADDLQRRLACNQLDQLGCQYHSVKSSDRAKEILASDTGVGVVIVDYATPGDGIEDALSELREVRPDVLFVGTSTAFRKREFASLGVDRFLTKPLATTALSALLQAE